MAGNRVGRGRRVHRTRLLSWCVGIAALAWATPAAKAVELPTGSDVFTGRWDNTFRYTYAGRTQATDPKILRNANTDDGDRNFSSGTALTRFDVLSELDLAYQGRHGVRASGAGWYDPAYSGGFNNGSLATSNQRKNGVPVYGLSPYTKEHYYLGAELLDLFAYTQVGTGDVTLNVKAGRHALFWGESLGFTGLLHSIGYSQGPVDVAKALATPGVEVKELFRPTTAVSAQLQLSSSLSLAVQYKLDWEPVRLPEGGTYYGTNDAAQWGGEWVYLAGAAGLPRGADVTRKDKYGDWGVAARWNSGLLDSTLGFYYRRFTDTIPQVLADLRGAPATRTYRFAYGSGIDLFGASFAKNIAGVSVGSEVSYRKNMPLVSETAAVGAAIVGPINSTYFPVPGDVPGARGDTLHVLLNALAVVPRTSLFSSLTWSAELAYSRWLKVTDRENLFKGRSSYTAIDRVTSDAWQLALGLTPSWLQVLPGVDLFAPISWSGGLAGNAATALAGSEGAGTYTGGLGVDVRQRYRLDVRYTGYYGVSRRNATNTGDIFNGTYALLRDRGNVSATFKTSF